MEDEKELIDSATKGDKAAFEKLITKYSKWVYGFIFNILRDENVGLDIVQETFIKVYQNLHRFDTEKSFTTWLFTIAKNNAFNYLKQNKRRCYISIDDATHDLNLINDDSSNPEKALEVKESTRNLIVAIDKLLEKYRVLIYLKYIHNMSYSEISIRLNIPVSVVESRLYTGRQKLLILLKEGVGK